MIDGHQYINDGKSDPPENSSWLTVVLQNVESNHSIIISFSQSSDDTGVADKYKHTVTAKSGAGGSVNPASQLVVDGDDGVINIIPDEGMAVDTISTPNQDFINNGK